MWREGAEQLPTQLAAALSLDPHNWCNVSPSPHDVSPTENSWMLHPLHKVSLGYFSPDRTIPSLNFDFLIAF
jgi:hypothetical protein